MYRLRVRRRKQTRKVCQKISWKLHCGYDVDAAVRWLATIGDVDRILRPVACDGAGNYDENSWAYFLTIPVVRRSLDLVVATVPGADDPLLPRFIDDVSVVVSPERDLKFL